MSKRAKLGLLLRFAILVILGLLIALVKLVNSEATVIHESNLKNNQKIEQLEKKNQQLKILQTSKIQEAAKPQTPPIPQPQMAAYSPVGSCEQYRPIVERYSWPTAAAMSVMDRESEGGSIPNGNCNPNALSSTQDRGLFQINQVHAAKVGGNLDALYDPETNIRVAYAIYQESGWRPWNCCRDLW